MTNRVCIFVLLAMTLFGTAWSQTEGVPPSERVGTTVQQPGEVQDFQRTAPPELSASSVSIVPPESPTVNPAEADKEAMEVIAATNAEIDKKAGQTVSPQANNTQKEVPTYSFWKMLFNTVIALCVVLAMLFFLGYGAKRMGKTTAVFAGTHLGQIMGKIYLAPRVCLHFVRTGGKVLVIGVTQNAIASVAEFEAEAFDALSVSAEPANKTEGSVRATTPRTGESFVSQLMAHLHQSRSKESVLVDEAESSAVPEDQELLALRNEIQSLRRFLDESSRETKV